MVSLRAILLAFVVLASSLARSGYAEPTDDLSVTPDTDKALGAGDTVSLQIVEDNTPAIVKRISDTGDLDAPYIGRVHAAGKSCADVAAQISKQLEKYYYKAPTVKLAIEKINPIKAGVAGKVFLSGAVKVTSPQEIPPGETLTVSGAVVKAGGANQFGDMRRVKLTRKNRDGTSKTYVIDVKAVLEEGKTDRDMELMDGDFIFMPQRLVTW